VHPDDRAAHRVFFEQVQSTPGTPITAQFRLRHADESWRDVEAVGQNLVHDPAVAGIVANYRDITDRKKSEEVPRRKSQLLQAIADGTQDAVYVKDREGRHLMFNVAASRMVGKPFEDVVGRDDTAIFDPESARAVMAHDRRVMESGIEASEEHELMVGGVSRTYLASKAPFRDAQGNVIGIIGICHDITERKRIEQSMRDSEQRWRDLTEALPQLVWSAMPDGSCDYFSAQWTEHTGVPESDLLGWRWLETLHPDDREPTRKCWLDSVAERHPYDIEYRVRRRDGEYRWFKTRGVPVRDSKGAIIKWFGTGTDITELRETQEALRQANARLDLAARGSNVAIWECDMPDGRLENDRMTLINFWELLGYEFKTTPTDFPTLVMLTMHPDDQERVGREIHEFLASDRQLFGTEVRGMHKSGSVRWHLTRGVAIRDPQGKAIRVIGTAADVTELKQAQEALRESEQRWRALTEALPLLVWANRPDGSMEYASAQVEQYLGRSESELLGWGWVGVLHPDDQERTEKAWRAAVAGQSEYDIEHRLRRFDGTYRWFKTRGVAARDADGRVYKWVGTCTDITTNIHLEEALRQANERVDLAVRSSDVCIWECNMPDGRIENAHLTLINVWESLGYDAKTLPTDFSSVFASYFHSDDQERVGQELHAFLASGGVGWKNEYRVLAKDGSIRWLLARGTVLRDASGKPIRFIGCSADITDRKRAEEALRERERQLDSLNRAKDEFLANVSHEIRTPMNAILGMAELTLDTSLTDEQRGYLNIILASAEGLLSLINDLLDFSKIEAGRLELDEAEFSLRTVLNQTLRALALRAHRKGLELACHVEQNVPDGLVGDGNRLRQVLLNLIGNAIKFTETGEVIVRVRATEADHKSLVIGFEIADTGIGIALEKQQIIFQAFEQADSSTTRRYGGTGLGLTISSRLVEMMGGRITVESELGRGSTFRFVARFGRSSRIAAVPAQPPVVDLHGLRVLIVDDNATNRTILQGWASAWGMIPTVTADGPAAMIALWRGVASKEPFALVLLDARMPGTDGLELAKGISQTPELGACRIILLTSDDRPGDAKRYRATGVSALLMKPVQQEELLDNIYRFCPTELWVPKSRNPYAPLCRLPSKSRPRRRRKDLRGVSTCSSRKTIGSISK